MTAGFIASPFPSRVIYPSPLQNPRIRQDVPQRGSVDDAGLFNGSTPGVRRRNQSRRVRGIMRRAVFLFVSLKKFRRPARQRGRRVICAGKKKNAPSAASPQFESAPFGCPRCRLEKREVYSKLPRCLWINAVSIWPPGRRRLPLSEFFIAVSWR